MRCPIVCAFVVVVFVMFMCQLAVFNNQVDAEKPEGSNDSLNNSETEKLKMHIKKVKFI